jgi:hypothetical protein
LCWTPRVSRPGLQLLATAIVALHFVSALAFNVVERQLTARMRGTVPLHVIYDGGQGVLRQVLRLCGQRKRHLFELDAAPHDVDRGQVGVTMTLSGANINECIGSVRRGRCGCRGASGRGRAELSQRAERRSPRVEPYEAR